MFLAGEKVVRGREQLRELALGELAERNPVVAQARVQNRPLEQAVATEHFEVHQPGITREGRIAEVGGVVAAVAREREDLPERHPRAGEPVDELVGVLAQRAHVLVVVERRWMEQDA